MTDDAGDAREERPLTDQERADLYREQLKRLHVVDLVRDMMVTLVTVGYEKLGLTEQTRDLRDLTDARVAIEALRRLIEVVEGEGDPEAASLRSTLAQMQLNFARASAEPHPPVTSRQPAAPSHEPDAPPEHEPAAAPAASEQQAPSVPPSERESQAPVEGESQPEKTPGAAARSASNAATAAEGDAPAEAASAKRRRAGAKAAGAKAAGAKGTGAKGTGGKDGAGGTTRRRRNDA